MMQRRYPDPALPHGRIWQTGEKRRQGVLLWCDEDGWHGRLDGSGRVPRDERAWTNPSWQDDEEARP